MTFFNGLFRNGRTTPTSAKPSPLEPSTPKSSAKEQSPQQPPSAFKPVSQRTDPKGQVEGRKEVTTPTPKGKKTKDGSLRVVRVKDFASPQGGVESSPSGPPPDRPLPPTPQPMGNGARVLGIKQDDSRYPTITRLGEALDTAAQRQPIQHQRTPSSSSQLPTRSTGPAQQPSKRQSIRFASPPHINPCPVLTTPIDTFPTLASMLHSPSSRGHLDRKKRPTALRLRTSNLTPANSTASSQLSPRRMEVGHGRKNTHVRTLQYSRSKKQIAVPTRAPTIAEQVEEEAVEQLGEASSERSIGTTVPTAPEPPSRPPLKFDVKPKDNPARTDLSTSTSQNPTNAAPPVVKDKEATLTPSESGSSSGTKPLPFDNVPLPWNTTSISQLQQDLGEDDFDHLIAYTLQHLSTTEPRLLPLSVLRTSASEETRLRNELKRLRGKYETLLRHRDTTLASLATGQVRNEPGAQRRALDMLSRAVGRCDRVVRQIYLCNDQIRQIEIQGEEHVVGALRVALEQNGREISGDVRSPLVVGQSEEEEVLASSPSTEEHGLPYLPKHGRIMKSNEEDLPRPRDLFDPKPRPESTASGFSINLGFPLPPSRSSPITSTPTLSMSTSSVDPHDTYPADETPKPDSRGRAASTSQLEIHVQTEDDTAVHLSDYSSHHEILILPPGHHRRSTSAPLFGNAGILDIPRSPWRGPHDHSPQRPTGFTPPLRLKGSPKREKGGKAKSLMEKRRSSDLTRRARRGRESQLQTPESILLSLATVESWARQNKEEEW